MVVILIINKGCELKELNVREFNSDDLYKKCGFKKDSDFSHRHTWKVPSAKFPFKSVQLWARDTGKANTENKYDFPPPIDNELYYGSCAIVAYDGEDNVVDLTQESWEKYYEFLFGGFEDLTSSALEDENEEDELENVPSELKTNDGYLKDGFVVDTDETEESAGSNDENELSYEDYVYSDED